MRFQQIIDSVENRPGVYLMLDAHNRPIYIGKAKDLKKRLKQYFSQRTSSKRTQHMLSLVDDIRVIITNNELEALVLENKLIKKEQPTYNVLLKDDKSFPYMSFRKHEFPCLTVLRVKQGQRLGHELYGPYPCRRRADSLLDQMQRVFRLRNCSDHYFRNRTRPCIQYEINRCTAPCVGYIDPLDYAKDVKLAKRFLKGGAALVKKEIIKNMYTYSESQDFERAGACRDLLKATTQASKDIGTSDVFIYEQRGGLIYILMQQMENNQIEHVYHDVFDVSKKHLSEDWFSQYVYQYYQLFGARSDVILVQSDQDLLPLTLAMKDSGAKVRKLNPQEDVQWLALAKENIQAYCQGQMDSALDWSVFWSEAEQYFKNQLYQILCFDVSHHQGESTYASCVVCRADGMYSSGYRSYRLQAGGDDCLAIKQAVSRKMKTELFDENTLIIIDGGKGQLRSASSVIRPDNKETHLISIAKGPGREWGREKFYREDNGEIKAFQCPAHMLKYLLHIRDQAHQFAIRSHRRSLRKEAMLSELDLITGLGKQRKKMLLAFFGGLEGVKCAKISDIKQVPGLGDELAKRIYDALHSG